MTGASFVTVSADETRALGQLLGSILVPGTVVALYGDLGCGKTVLVQGVARGLCFDGYVSSPSFVIVNEYDARLPIFHIDLYRTGGSDPLAGVDYREFLWGGGVALVEWAERARELLPDDRLDVTLRAEDRTTREIAFAATGPASAGILAALDAAWREREASP